MCNFLEYKGQLIISGQCLYVFVMVIDNLIIDIKIVYWCYVLLFFIVGCFFEDNEFIIFEIIYCYVEQMDKYYGNVCEFDIIFFFIKVYYIFDELLLVGEFQESSKKGVL